MRVPGRRFSPGVGVSRRRLRDAAVVVRGRIETHVSVNEDGRLQGDGVRIVNVKDVESAAEGVRGREMSRVDGGVSLRRLLRSGDLRILDCGSAFKGWRGKCLHAAVLACQKGEAHQRGTSSSAAV